MKEILYRNNITVKKSDIQGYGVFAAQDIKAGEVIEECPVLLFDQPVSAIANHCFEWKNRYALLLGYGAIYNHAKYRNATCKADYGNECTAIKAIENIKAGEEIFISYGDGWLAHRDINDHTKQRKPQSMRSFLYAIPKQIYALIAIVIIVLLFFAFHL